MLILYYVLIYFMCDSVTEVINLITSLHSLLSSKSSTKKKYTLIIRPDARKKSTWTPGKRVRMITLYLEKSRREGEGHSFRPPLSCIRHYVLRTLIFVRFNKILSQGILRKM